MFLLIVIDSISYIDNSEDVIYWAQNCSVAGKDFTSLAEILEGVPLNGIGCRHGCG